MSECDHPIRWTTDRVFGVREERVLDDDGGPAAGLQRLDEVLQEQEGGLAGLDGEVLLDLLALLAAEGRVGQDDLEAVPVLQVVDVLAQGVGVDDVGPRCRAGSCS